MMRARRALFVVLASLVIKVQFPDVVSAPEVIPVAFPEPMKEEWRPPEIDDADSEVLYRIAGGGDVNVLHSRILEVVAQVFQEAPQITGTNRGREYQVAGEYLHRDGYAIDIATGWRTSFRERDLVDLTKQISRHLASTVDWRVRVVLYQGHAWKPDHLHIAVRANERWRADARFQSKREWEDWILNSRWSLNGK
jgi:hypothetical protein